MDKSQGFLVLMLSMLWYSSVKGALFRVDQNQASCLDTTVIFECTNSLPFINWDIRTRAGNVQVSFRSGNDIGNNRTRTLNSSEIIAELSYINKSYISSTVAITRPININGSTITCLSDELQLTIPESKSTLPTFLTIFKENGMISIMWESGGSCICVYVNGRREVVNNSSVSLQLANKSLEIIISLNAVHNNYSNFTIGPCLYFDPFIETRNYSVYFNQTWFIYQACINSILQFNTICNTNGLWTPSLSCQEFTTNSLDQYLTTLTPTTFTVSTPQVNMVTVVITTAVVTFVISLSIGFIFGLFCGIMYMHMKTKKLNINRKNPNIDQISHDQGMIKFPEYEQVELEVNTTTVDLMQNVAYEKVNKNVL